MRCKEVRRELYAYLDGSLQPDAVEGIDHHLRQCRSCADAVENERRLSAWLRDTADWRVDRCGFDQQPEVMDVERRKRGRHFFPRGIHPGFRPARLVLAVMGVILILLVIQPTWQVRESGISPEHILSGYEPDWVTRITVSDDLGSVEEVVIESVYDHTIALVRVSIEFE